jgi:hypothetical protein
MMIDLEGEGGEKVVVVALLLLRGLREEDLIPTTADINATACS